MKRLYKIINDIVDNGKRAKVDLRLDFPRIVVIGDQSSGKSSVLDAIVGHDFLPRGENMVTRCPIVIQLQKHDAEEDYAEFVHREGTKFTVFDDVRAEIMKETRRMTKNEKGITDKPIIVKVYSKGAPNLTLVDLPGLINIVDRDQPENTAEEIETLVLNEVKIKNTIILAISAANHDLANSKGLALARKVDPTGSRTIGVLTKLDMMEKGTNALNILNGTDFKLKFGYIGVVCRSKDDVKNGISLKVARDNERLFFEMNSVYSEVKDRCGISYLSTHLENILVDHIKACLPSFRQQIEKEIERKYGELNSFGVPLTGNINAILTQIISKYGEFYHNLLDTFDEATLAKNGAIQQKSRIHFIINDIFREKLSEINALDNVTDELLISTIISESSLKFCLFMPDSPFVNIMQMKIKKLLEPSLQCLKDVYNEIRELLQTPNISILAKLPRLKDRIFAETVKYLDECKKNTTEKINDDIRAEMNQMSLENLGIKSFAHIIFKLFSQEFLAIAGADLKKEENNDKHDEIIDSTIDKIMEKKAREVEEVAPEEKQEEQKVIDKKGNEVYFEKLAKANYNASYFDIMKMNSLKELLDSYFEHVKKKIAIAFPKKIMDFFVNAVTMHMEERLILSLHMMKDIDELLSEDPEITEGRIKCKKAIDILEDAKIKIDQAVV